MDFDTILYILLMVGWLGFTVFKALRKDEAERTDMKNKHRPIAAETVDHTEAAPAQKKASAKRPVQQTVQSNEYFSYETMSDRDFEQAFSNNVEENGHIAAASAPPQPTVHLSMDEEEVFKGIVWSEILNRKY